MKAKLVGEWVGNKKKASGIAGRLAPETTRGFEERAARQGLRVWCGECQELRAIAECTGLTETQNSSTYAVILEICGHQRSVTLAVEFTPSRKNKREWAETDPGIAAISSEMTADNTLGEA
jgi:hypothetical protein